MAKYLEISIELVKLENYFINTEKIGSDKTIYCSILILKNDYRLLYK